MRFFKFAKSFQCDEGGAVTVDWVVLTAAVVGLGVAVISTVAGGTKDLGSTISNALSGTELQTY